MAMIMEGIFNMPPVTRVYTTACVFTTLAIQLELVTPFQLYFHWDLIAYQFQFWRLITSFCYLGSFGFNFLFNLIFTYKYCQMLEEGSFQGRRADFVYMLFLGALAMIICGIFVQVLFLGHAFTMMLVYVWSRHNPHVRMNFVAALTFNAPYLPWVLLFFSVLLGNNALVDFLGILCGHIYYFLEDVYPRQQGGYRFLQTPLWLKKIFDEPPLPYVPEDERPGGFEWGGPPPE